METSGKPSELTPILSEETYLKYGFVPTRTIVATCPSCFGRLNAGPNYTPKFCDNCGCKLNWQGVTWRKI